MLAAVYYGVGDLRLEQVPRPRASNDTAVLKVEAAAICGSDVRTYFKGSVSIPTPQILGHEVAGTLVEVGKAVEDVKEGDLVQVAPAMGCGGCTLCVRGHTNVCTDLNTLGYEVPGAFAEYMTIPSRAVFQAHINKVTEGLSADEAALAEPLACTLNAHDITHTGLGDTVVVIGDGPIGLMHVRVARLRGASRVILVGRRPDRLALAERYDPDAIVDSRKEEPKAAAMRATMGGADVVICAAATREAQLLGLELVRPRGRVNFFGGLPKHDQLIPLNSNHIHYNEIFLSGTHASTAWQNRLALKLMARGKIDVKPLITHTLPLSDILEGLELQGERKAMKVVLHPQAD